MIKYILVALLFNAQNLLANSEVTGAAPAGGLLGSLIPFIVIFLIFYFLIIRPQNKKFKAHQLMINELKTGDKIITSGGVVAKITKINKDSNTISVSIANGVEIEIIRATISNKFDN